MTDPHSQPVQHDDFVRYAAAHDEVQARESGRGAAPDQTGGVRPAGAHSRPVPLHDGPSRPDRLRSPDDRPLHDTRAEDHPDRIRRDIERTQGALSSDISALADKINPGRVIEHGMNDVRAAAGRLRDRTNPLAAGAVAFGLGWLLSSLVPAGKQEQRVAEQTREQVVERSEPVVDAVRQAAGELKDSLAEPARDAVTSVRSTAADSAQTVTGETRSAATDVRDQAADSAAAAEQATRDAATR